MNPDTPLLFGEREEAARGAGPLFVLVVMVLAALLRFLDLGGGSLWIDEYLTWRMVNPPEGWTFWEQFRDNVQGPLYLAVLWPFAQGAPDEFLMRLPAAVAGVLAVPLMLALGAELRDRRTGEWAALLLALNPFHLFYSQEARGYAFLVLFSLAASVVLLRMRRRGPTLGAALAYGALSGLAILSNMSALFLIAAQALGVLLFARPRDRAGWTAWLVAFGLAGLVAVPWLLQAAGFWYPGRLAPGGGGIVPEGQAGLNPLAYPFTVFALTYGFSLGPSLRELHGADRLQLVREAAPLLALAGLALAAPLVLGWTRLRARVRWELLLWILVPVACLTVLRLLDMKTFNPRYVATVLPALLVATAAGLAALRGRRAVLFALPLLALTAWSVVNARLDDRYARDDVGAAAEWISAHHAAGEPALVPVVTEVFRLYADPGLEIRDFWDAGTLTGPEAAGAALDARLAGTDAAWLVLSRTGALDPGHHLEHELAARGRIVERRSWPGVEALRWRRRPEPASPVTEER